MEAELLWWRYLDDIYHRVDLTYSFVYYSGYNFVSANGIRYWYVIVFI